MTNYQNDIMDLLQGETPKQKYDFLKEMLTILKENNSGVENELLNVCYKLEIEGVEMYAKMGNESYIDRCNKHDAKILIYSLTNKSKIERMSFIKWREKINAINS